MSMYPDNTSNGSLIIPRDIPIKDFTSIIRRIEIVEELLEDIKNELKKLN